MPLNNEKRMNFKLSHTDSTHGHLIILTDGADLEWVEEYLENNEIEIMASLLAEGVKQFMIPRKDGHVFVQCLKSHGKPSITSEESRLAGAEMLNLLENHLVESVTLLDKAGLNQTYAYAEGMALGNYQFLKYLNEENKSKVENKLKDIRVHTGALDEAGFENLHHVVRGTLKARDLINEPFSYLTAPQLSKEIADMTEEVGLDLKVLEKADMEKMGMGGILAVNKGSFTPPKFNIIEWKPEAAKNERPIVLVGKGVVYDTGGLSLKPTKNSMDFMKCDMAGAATVVGTMMSVALAKMPLHIIGLIPSSDNRPGNDAYAPGDVVKMYSGLTVEVLNTDAEGRMLLADALHYAKQYEPELVFDFATLTGAAVRAVGYEGMAFMGTADSKVKHALEISGHNVYERLIEFPLWREYADQLKSAVADITNLGSVNAGHITAGKFLEYFTDYPWIHIDVAGPAYLQKASGYRTREGTGVGVRLMFDFLKSYE